MSKLKLMSVLQSRIAKRKTYLGTAWQLYSEIKAREEHYQAHHWKVAVNNVGKLQKEDKQILKQLVEDARHKQHYVEVVYVINKELQVLRRELASYKITGLPYALHHLRGADESKRRVY
jgi:hypothetical protein